VVATALVGCPAGDFGRTVFFQCLAFFLGDVETAGSTICCIGAEKMGASILIGVKTALIIRDPTLVPVPDPAPDPAPDLIFRHFASSWAAGDGCPI